MNKPVFWITLLLVIIFAYCVKISGCDYQDYLLWQIIVFQLLEKGKD